MNIIEVTGKALTEGVGIANPEIIKRANSYLLPTNTDECYFIIPLGYKTGDNRRPAVRWNPKASDILRNDWELHPSA